MEPIDLDLDESYDSTPFRSRSNTWPLPRPDLIDSFACSSNNSVSIKQEIIDEVNEPLSIGANDVIGNNLTIKNEPVIPTTTHEPGTLDQASNGQPGGQKKNTSRRNAWGNMSYADLITQAIQGSPEKRLTLSQIYDWMVQNVPYFKDKGDSNSSAGWKNSIRHNLSLHNRFMRVQNEGTGKSSWWMINPEAKPGKAARRRATSMETQKYEKKRGRVKKKVEALRNGLLEPAPSPSSSVSEGQDMFPESPLHHGFQLSPEFRPRASSNASSLGRLSPIPAVESDMHDSQVPPLSPISGWNSELGRLYSNTSDIQDQFNTEQLVELANTMKLGGGNAFLGVTKTSPGQLSPASSHGALNSNTYTTLNNYGSLSGYSNGSGTLSRNGSDPFFQTAGLENNITLTSLNALNGTRSPTRLLSAENLSSNYSLTNMSPSLSPSQSMDTLTSASQSGSTSNFHSPQHQSGVHHQSHNASQIRGSFSSGPENGISIRSAINSASKSSLISSANSAVTSLGTTASQVMGHLLSLNNPLPNDLDLNTFDSLQGGLECDVDQVIRHELSVDGNLDFNFDPLHGNSSSATAVSSASSRSWVH